MLRRLLRCLASCLIVLSLSAPAVMAQAPAGEEDEQSEKSNYALPYFVLILYTMLILTVVCMPSRKA